jgi:hypothetical protein
MFVSVHDDAGAKKGRSQQEKKKKQTNKQTNKERKKERERERTRERKRKESERERSPVLNDPFRKRIRLTTQFVNGGLKSQRSKMLSYTTRRIH